MKVRTLSFLLATLIAIYNGVLVVCDFPGALDRLVSAAEGTVNLSNAYLNSALHLSMWIRRDSSLIVCQSGDLKLKSAEKSLRQVVSWWRMGAKTEFSTNFNATDADYIMIEKCYASRMRSCVRNQFICCADSGPWLLLRKEKPGCVRGQEFITAMSWWSSTRAELCSFLLFIVSLVLLAGFSGIDFALFLLAVFSLLAGVIVNLEALSIAGKGAIMTGAWYLSVAVFIVRTLSKRQKFTIELPDVCIGLLLFAIFACLSVSHPLATPNVASVVGGKAKWLVLNGGFSAEFWRGGYCTKDMLPAYPPCLALIVAAMHLMFKTFDTWVAQVFGAFTSCLVFWAGCKIMPNRIGRISLIAFLLSPIACQVFTALYPDGLMVAMLLSGFALLSKSEDDIFGWFLVGTAGLVKNEGVIFSAIIILWMSSLNIRPHLSHIIVCFAIPVSWHVATRLLGASLPDYSISHFSFSGLAMSFCRVNQCLIQMKTTWLVMAVYIVSVSKDVKGLIRRVRFLVCSWAVFMTIFSIIYAFGVPEELEWHVRTSANRLMWVMGILLLSVMAKQPQREVPKERPSVDND